MLTAPKPVELTRPGDGARRDLDGVPTVYDGDRPERPREQVILLEFNELSPVLLERFIADGILPNFARMRDSSLTAITDAGEKPPHLEPWIQWVTVHTGLSFAEHRCFLLNDGSEFEYPRLWDYVCRAGGRAWVCGSMNARIEPDTFNGFFLPDPWTTKSSDYPAGRFKPFLDVVRPYVQENSGRPNVSVSQLVAFARFMASEGLSMQTVVATLRQLVEERSSNSKWRRAMILDRLQWDLFRSVYKACRPQLATFFLNSTAHFQHFHWREMEPELFSVKPTQGQQEAYGNAIAEGYRNMDRILGQAMALAGDHATVILCTALSQQPMLIHELAGGRQIFRHRDIRELLRFAGVEEMPRYEPLMSQQFLLHFDDADHAADAAQKLEALRLEDGLPVMWAKSKGSMVNGGCEVSRDPAGLRVASSSSNETRPFRELFYPLEALRSGMHHPDGVLWIKGPGVRPMQLSEKVPLASVAPIVLDLLKTPAGAGPAAPGADAAI